MSEQQCPCAKLDWRDVDQTAEHHPDCLAKTVEAAKRFAEVAGQVVTQIRSRFELFVVPFDAVALPTIEPTIQTVEIPVASPGVTFELSIPGLDTEGREGQVLATLAWDATPEDVNTALEVLNRLNWARRMICDFNETTGAGRTMLCYWRGYEAGLRDAGPSVAASPADEEDVNSYNVGREDALLWLEDKRGAFLSIK